MTIRRRNTAAVAILLAATLALSPLAAATALAAPAGAVKGSVKSAMTGSAMSGVKVRVFDMNRAEFVAEAVTGEDGSLSFAELPFGLYQITVVAPEGYASAAGPLIHLRADYPAATVGFNLEALPNAPAALQLGVFPWWAFLAIGGGVATLTTTAIVSMNDAPNVPVGTR